MMRQGVLPSTVISLLLIFLQVPNLVIGREQQWNYQCPPSCTCHESHFSELPLHRFLHEAPSNEDDTPVPPHFNNSVIYEDDGLLTKEENRILKMAMCVFQLGTEPFTLLSMLSTDVQALIILQARDSDEIALEADHLSHLKQLEVLEIHGFYHEASNHSQNELPTSSKESDQRKLVLRNDALRPLASLKYLNLQYVKLLGHLSQGNRVSPAVIPLDPISNEISANIGMQYSTKKLKHRGTGMRRLVFLPPLDGDGDILPYEVYVEQQEQAALSTFTGLINLEFVRVFGCGLREINWEMFDGLYNLHYLSLEKNNLLFIPDFAFLGAPNLRTLSLAQNQLLSLQSTSLAGLFELEKLELSHNNFSHLSELSLPPFPKLRIADFRHNPIESIFASTFEIMNATSILYIGDKETVLGIQPNSFLGLTNLRKLNILNVGILMLERELLRGMPKLKGLEINGVIEELSFDAFLEVPKLENLVLKHCGIRSISMDAFYGLYGLLYLDLSDNLLESLPPGLFDQQFSLRELSLRNNKLNRLPPGFLSNIPAKMIRLDGNPWHCTCAMKDWQPAVINKVKQRGPNNFCQFQYDKGNMCNRTVSAVRYNYDRRVAPLCTSPSKFKNWSVFQVLRKELRCNKKPHFKMDRKAYLKKKYEDYENSIKSPFTWNTPIFKYYQQNANHMYEKKKTIPQNATGNTDVKENSTTKVPQNTSTTTIFTKSTETTPNSFILSTAKPISSTHMTENVTNKTEVTDATNTVTATQSTPIDYFGIQPTTDSTPHTITTQNSNQTSTRKPDATSNTPDIKPTKQTSTSEEVTSTDLVYGDRNISHKSKKEKQKMELLREMKEKSAAKENVKPYEPNNMITDEKGKQIKLSKKAWKLEMERKRQEKLKRYQTMKQ
ncbi:uncharacterized protein [Periplaneta americana]|uniref:uncharacterized protein n=1 Tax=Periplaneta americana TaxID=6978 RepID=UPI0037E9C0FB